MRLFVPVEKNVLSRDLQLLTKEARSRSSPRAEAAQTALDTFSGRNHRDKTLNPAIRRLREGTGTSAEQSTDRAHVAAALKTETEPFVQWKLAIALAIHDIRTDNAPDNVGKDVDFGPEGWAQTAANQGDETARVVLQEKMKRLKKDQSAAGLKQQAVSLGEIIRG